MYMITGCRGSTGHGDHTVPNASTVDMQCCERLCALWV